ncbi:MAG: hypothetical protein HYR76_01615 [Ignavibacteria bacterium]|nr:hypothetical protein [Ignavibacteria bacterium]MBI3765280.1 hypothetical protein [Ignavibacteriales bacterium]
MTKLLYNGVLVLFVLTPSVHSTPFAQERQQTDSLPTLYTVHIDEVEPEMVNRFEELSERQSRLRNTILKEHHLPLRTSYEISTAYGMYMTFRPRSSFTEFDQQSTTPPDVRKILQEKVNVMDDSFHATLRTHHNEIWQLDKEMAYFPTQSASKKLVPGFIHIRSELVKPGKDGVYDTLTKKFHEALIKQQHPIGCLVFFGQYGDGSYKFVWQAEGKEQYQQAGGTEAIFLAAFGKQEADRLMNAWRDCLIKVTDLDATPRPDLNSLEPAQGWFGVPLQTH